MPETALPGYRLADGVVHRSVAEEMVLVHTASQQYYGLDRVGADILRQLIAAPLPEALATLADTYAIDPSRLAKDVTALVGDLVAAGLLQATDERAPN